MIFTVTGQSNHDYPPETTFRGPTPKRRTTRRQRRERESRRAVNFKQRVRNSARERDRRWYWAAMFERFKTSP